MKQGDILVSKSVDGFGLLKVLRMSDFPDGTQTAHVLTYETFSIRPTLEDLATARVLLWHAPIDCQGLERESEVIGNVPVDSSELVGYLEYLKLTDFRGYLEESGVSADEVIASATAAYDAGNALCDQNRFKEAVEKYDEAIAEFPLFYEAHDNRAFALMDIGYFREAADGFSESLRFAPDNPVALFSLGECRLKTGEAEEAAKIFRECMKRWPNQAHHREFLARAEALLSPVAKPAKSWWRFW